MHSRLVEEQGVVLVVKVPLRMSAFEFPASNLTSRSCLLVAGSNVSGTYDLALAATPKQQAV